MAQEEIAGFSYSINSLELGRVGAALAFSSMQDHSGILVLPLIALLA
jgi:hypothetical protein